jgi:hypothetical protein
MSVQTWELLVDRNEFRKALRIAAQGAKTVESDTAILTFDQDNLRVDLSGNIAVVSATGDWPSEVRLQRETLKHLAKSLPEQDPLPLKIEGERMLVARFSIPCEWRLYSRPATSPVRDLIPANPDLFDLLVVAASCSQEEIDDAGAATLVSNAQRKLDQICQKAAGFLGIYGVSALDLRRLCEQHASDGTRQFLESESKAIGQVANAWSLLAFMGVEPGELKNLMDSSLRNAWKNPK